MVLPARIPLDACHQFRSEVAGFLRNSAQVTRQAWTGISGRFGLEYSVNHVFRPEGWFVVHGENEGEGSPNILDYMVLNPIG